MCHLPSTKYTRDLQIFIRFLHIYTPKCMTWNSLNLGRHGCWSSWPNIVKYKKKSLDLAELQVSDHWFTKQILKLHTDFYACLYISIQICLPGKHHWKPYGILHTTYLLSIFFRKLWNCVIFKISTNPQIYVKSVWNVTQSILFSISLF